MRRRPGSGGDAPGPGSADGDGPGGGPRRRRHPDGRSRDRGDRGRTGGWRRWRREPVAVVTDLREPLVVQHRRRIRIRLAAMVLWIAGWIVAGALWRHGWLATGILLGSGPGVWLLWWLLVPHPTPARRHPVPHHRRALEGRKSPQ